MTAKTPIRTVFNESGTATGLAEFQTGEFIAVEHGGTGAVTHTSNAILLGNGTSAIQGSAIGISGTTLSSTDSTLITIDEGLTVTGSLNVSGTITGTFSGNITGSSTAGNIQVGVTGNNEIDTSSGNLTLDSAGGTVAIDDNLTVSGNTTVTGNLTVNGTTTTVNSTTIEITNSFTFEGSTADDYETVLGVVDPTADRTINLPNASGTIVLQDTTDTLTNKTIDSASNTLTVDLSEATVTGTTSEFNSALSDGSFATLAGTETLTNKTLTTPVISSISNTGTITLPTSTDTLVGRATTDTLTNKTLTSPVLNTGVSGTAILDEDNMASDSATQLATQQSIKAYVDTQVGAVSTSSISEGDSNVTVTDSGTGSITIAADGGTIITMNATTVLDASATTNAIRLPNGTTAQRPSGSVGEIRYNSSTDTIEGYTSAGGWAQLGATTATAENTDDTTTGDGTAISTSQGVIDQFVTSSFDSAWYLTVTRDEINDEVSTAKHSLVHNDSSAFVATSHITESDPTNAYLTAQADVAGGNARLLATGGSVVNSVSTYRIALGDNTSAGTTGNVVTSINTDVDSASEVVDSWAHASYRGAKYYISVNNASKTEVSNMEALVVHDGTTAFITTYGLVNTGSNDLLSLTAAINGSNVELSAAGNEPNLRVTMYKILLADDEAASTGDNVNVIEATTVSSSATTIDSFATTAYTGAFYVFTGHNATEGASSISEVMVVANDEAYITTGQ